MSSPKDKEMEEKNICRVKGCNNYGMNRGIDKITGEKRYRKICEFHRNIDKNKKRAMNYLKRKSGDNRELKTLMSGGKCIGGHTWTFAGGREFVPEGTPCDCGMVKYETPKYCEKCGQQITK